MFCSFCKVSAYPSTDTQYNTVQRLAGKAAGDTKKNNKKEKLNGSVIFWGESVYRNKPSKGKQIATGRERGV